MPDLTPAMKMALMLETVTSCMLDNDMRLFVDEAGQTVFPVYQDQTPTGTYIFYLEQVSQPHDRFCASINSSDLVMETVNKAILKFKEYLKPSSHKEAGN